LDRSGDPSFDERPGAKADGDRISQQILGHFGAENRATHVHQNQYPIRLRYGLDALLDVDRVGPDFGVRFADASGGGNRERVAYGASDQINRGFGESAGVRDQKKSKHQ
jgi:hypothetical protein